MFVFLQFANENKGGVSLKKKKIFQKENENWKQNIFLKLIINVVSYLRKSS